MKKASELVDEHEEVTARHAPLASMVPGQRFAETMRFPDGELDSLLRSESGLRAAVSPEEIALQMENDLKAMPPFEGRRPFSDIVPAQDHARPFDSFVTLTPGAGFAPAPDGLPLSTKPAQPRYLRWIIPAAIASLLLLVSSAVALGFVLGRLSGQH